MTSSILIVKSLEFIATSSGNKYLIVQNKLILLRALKDKVQPISKNLADGRDAKSEGSPVSMITLRI